MCVWCVHCEVCVFMCVWCVCIWCVRCVVCMYVCLFMCVHVWCECNLSMWNMGKLLEQVMHIPCPRQGHTGEHVKQNSNNSLTHNPQTLSFSQAVVAHIFNASNQEAEASRSLGLRLA